MTDELCYSVDEEAYYDDVQHLLDHCEEYLSHGDSFNYWVGIKKRYQHSDFVNSCALTDCIERMSERAYEDAGEWSDGYLNDKLSEEVVDEFKEMIIRFMDKFFKSPEFFTVVNVRKVNAIWDGSDFCDETTQPEKE